VPIFLPPEVIDAAQLKSNSVTVDHLWELVKFDAEKELKIFPKFTEKILSPSHFDKMSVASAVTIFSADVSRGLVYLVQHHGYSEDLLTTAWFLETVRHWFDLVNCRKLSNALSRKNIDKYNEAISFLEKVVELFKSITVGPEGNWKPVQTGVIMATTTVLQLQKDILDSGGIEYFMTSRLSQDALENTFSIVRLKDALPTPKQVKYGLRNICISQFSKEQKGSNYDYDDCTFLTDFLAENAGKKTATHEPCTDNISVRDTNEIPMPKPNSFLSEEDAEKISDEDDLESV
jgi:hypothetical protein